MPSGRGGRRAAILGFAAGLAVATAIAVPVVRHARRRPIHPTPAPPPSASSAIRDGVLADLAAARARGDADAAARAQAWLCAEAFAGADAVGRAWLGVRDRATGLLPRSVDPTRPRPIWNTRDVAADLYGHLVIEATLLGPERLAPLREILDAERRAGPDLPISIDLRTGGPIEEPEVDRVFGAVEYAKDGLLAIAERTGTGPWFDRLLEVTAGVFAHAPLRTAFGPLPSSGAEKNGEALQVLARLARRDPDPRWRAWGRGIARAYVEEVLPATDGLPPLDWDFAAHRPKDPRIRLLDHGNETIAGLVEWALFERTTPEGASAPLVAAVTRMLDRLLEKGRRADGLFHGWVPGPGGVVEAQPMLNDNWGYLSCALLSWAQTLPRGDPARARYEEAVRRAFGAATRLPYGAWGPREAMDSSADALEGGMYVLAALDDAEGEAWVDREVGSLLSHRRVDDFVERTYLDGNFIRTTLLYGLRKSRGIVPTPWSPAIRVGAEQGPDGLHVHVQAVAAWTGRLRFDGPRHSETFRLDVDYPRLNAWPEGFVASPERVYLVTDLTSGATDRVSGARLREGIETVLAAGETRRLRVRASD